RLKTTLPLVPSSTVVSRATTALPHQLHLPRQQSGQPGGGAAIPLQRLTNPPLLLNPPLTPLPSSYPQQWFPVPPPRSPTARSTATGRPARRGCCTSFEAPYKSPTFPQFSSLLPHPSLPTPLPLTSPPLPLSPLAPPPLSSRFNSGFPCHHHAHQLHVPRQQSSQPGRGAALPLRRPTNPPHFLMVSRATTALTNCTFHGNRAASQAGALHFMPYGPLTITNCSFSNNSVLLSQGGAINVYPGLLPVYISGSRFEGNKAGLSRGGAIYSESTEMVFTDVVFQGNEAGLQGGAVTGRGCNGR
ncbi:unnamed protein product, partial [Closterium sp. NIES-54]